jgi:glycerol kinase
VRLEGIAYQVYDLAKSMEADFGEKGKELKVDGGACNNNDAISIRFVRI